MYREIKFKKGRILFGILFSATLLLISISFILTSEKYLRNIYSTETYIQIIGTLMFLFSTALLYSFIRIINRTKAIIITEDYLIDNSKYESIGKIKWSDVSNIKRLKKKSIKIHFKESYINMNKNNPLKAFLRMMTNWNFRSSVIISSALVVVDIDELFKSISSAYKEKK